MAQQQSGQWARQQKEGLERQERNATENEARKVAEGGEADRQSEHAPGGEQGDNRTPDKTIGQVKYADDGGEDRKKNEGRKKSGGSDQNIPLEPEKQGGIGGP